MLVLKRIGLKYASFALFPPADMNEYVEVP